MSFSRGNTVNSNSFFFPHPLPSSGNPGLSPAIFLTRKKFELGNRPNWIKPQIDRETSPSGIRGVGCVWGKDFDFWVSELN